MAGSNVHMESSSVGLHNNVGWLPVDVGSNFVVACRDRSLGCSVGVLVVGMLDPRIGPSEVVADNSERVAAELLLHSPTVELVDLGWSCVPNGMRPHSEIVSPGFPDYG